MQKRKRKVGYKAKTNQKSVDLSKCDVFEKKI